MTHPQALQTMLELAHDLGREERGFAILGEGNTSARHTPETFYVKASGTTLGTLRPEDTVECQLNKILPLFDRAGMSDAAVDDALLASRVDPKAKKPSVETLFHAWLLSLPDIEFVGHVHAIAVNQILCSSRGREFAENRMFPDEIVCCGPASVYVPYTDPGVPLARVIRTETEAFIKRHQRQPRVILMENHGVIGLGKTRQAVLSALLMAEKAAKIFVGAAALGGPVFFSDANIQRIVGRPDEHYRARALNL